MTGLDAKDILKRHGEARERRSHWEEHWRASMHGGLEGSSNRCGSRAVAAPDDSLRKHFGAVPAKGPPRSFLRFGRDRYSAAILRERRISMISEAAVGMLVPGP